MLAYLLSQTQAHQHVIAVLLARRLDAPDPQSKGCVSLTVKPPEFAEAEVKFKADMTMYVSVLPLSPASSVLSNSRRTCEGQHTQKTALLGRFR